MSPVRSVRSVSGNNWTPRLSVGALHWVIAFWHEQRAIAEEVLRMINDLLWSARARRPRTACVQQCVATP